MENESGPNDSSREIQAGGERTQPNSHSLGSDLGCNFDSGSGTRSSPSVVQSTGSFSVPKTLNSKLPSSVATPGQQNNSTEQNFSSSGQNANNNRSSGPSISGDSQISIGEQGAMVSYNMEKAKTAENEGNHTEAHKRYSRALRLQRRLPNDLCRLLQISRMIASSSVQLKDYRQAIDELKDCLRKCPPAIQSHDLRIEEIQTNFMLALVYRQLGQYQQEISYFETVLQILSDDAGLASQVEVTIRRYLYRALMRASQSLAAHTQLELAQTDATENDGREVQLLNAIEELFPWEETVQISDALRNVQPESTFPTLPNVMPEALESSDDEMELASVQQDTHLVADLSTLEPHI